MKRTVYVGLPCYNEEKDINKLLDRLLKIKTKVNNKYGYDFKIFCVNDGSSDNTKKIIEKRKVDKIKLINHKHNQGLGQAMKTILNEFNKVAKENDFLVVMDADNTHNPKYILDLIDKQKENNSDVVIASRYQKGAKITGLKKHRILISDMAKLWYTMMLKIPKVKDYTCGYRLYTYNIINNGLKKFGNNIITKTSFACMMELLYKLHLTGANMSEVPFSLEYEKKTGSSKMKIFKTTKDSLITTIKIKNENKSSDIIAYIIILLMTIGLLTVSCSTQKNVGLALDPATYLNVARNILKGKTLYVDIVDNKGPILYLINALFLKLGGKFGIVVLEFLLLFTSFLYLYKTLKLINNNKIQRIIIIILSYSFLACFYMYGLSCEEYALCFSSIGLYECMKYYKKDYFTKKQCLLLGILCALCFFIRQNLVNIFAGFAIGILIKLIIEKKYKELLKYIFYALLGFISVTIPVFAYLLIKNSFHEYIELTFILNMTLNKLGYGKALLTLFIIAPFAAYVIFAYFIILTKKIFFDKEIKELGIYITIIITIAFNIISTLIYLHYLVSFIPIILLSYNELFNNKYLKTYIILFIIFISILFNVLRAKELFYVPQPNQFIIEYIKDNTSKKDKIAVIGFFDEIYYLSERDSVSKHTYVLSNNAFKKENQQKILNEYFNDIMNRKPKIIVQDHNTMKNGVKPYIDLKEYNDFLEKNYVKISTMYEKDIYKLNPDNKFILIMK